MKKILIVAVLLWAGVAYAQFNGCPVGFCNLSSGGGSPPPVCSNSLDFSNACNSSNTSIISAGFAQ